MPSQSSPSSSPATMTTPSSTLASASYKGKTANRSWNTLPAEILRLIVTHFFLDASLTGYLPQTWENRERWLPRMAYNVVRDANALETIMKVSPTWKATIEHHLFWQQATAVFDPHDLLLCFQFNPQRLSPYKHFRLNVYERSCAVCRINHPTTTAGLGVVKRKTFTFALGVVPCCKEHRKERFCGICLRDVHADESITENEDIETWPYIEATCRSCRAEWLWKACVEASAREREAIGGKHFAPSDWEARQAVDTFIEVGEGNIREVIALALEKWWLRKNTKIADMMSLAVATSRLQTRVAAAEGFADSEGDLSGAEADADGDDDEEEDPDLMSITEDVGGVRDLAINDWARMRILDGFWVSPADQWYQRDPQRQSHPPSYTNSPQIQPAFLSELDPSTPYIPANHPCPWTLPEDEVNSSHPSPSSMQSSPPPSLSMCSTAFEAYKRQLRLLLLPAMTNIVRRIVIECAADGVDACVKVARMEVEDVASALRDGGTWYNGMDWFNARRNDRKVDTEVEDEGLALKEHHEEEKKEDTDDSSNSSRSSSSSKSGSQTTSPVLSITTLQTTPSPPPRSETGSKKSDCELEQEPEPDQEQDTDSTVHPMASATTTVSEESSRAATVIESRPHKRELDPVSVTVPPLVLPIAISPVLDSPTPIPSIPFIPESIADLPPFTIDAFKNVWREAIAPLFQCRCRICERAVLKANIEAGNIALPEAEANVNQDHHQNQNQIGKEQVWYGEQREIALEMDVTTPATDADVTEADPDDLDGMVVSPNMESDEESLDGEEEQEQEEEEQDTRVLVTNVSTRLRIPPRVGTKRSCEVLEYIDEGNGNAEEDLRSNSSGRGGTPPKRARIDEPIPQQLQSESPLMNSNVGLDNAISPRRVVKRRSEELEDARVGTGPGERRVGGGREDTHGHVAKRQRQTPPPTSESASASEGGEGEADEIVRYALGGNGGAKQGGGGKVVSSVMGMSDVEAAGLYVLEDEEEDG